MTPRAVSRQNDMVKLQTQVLRSLGHNPDVGLIAVVDWVGVGIFRGESIVNAKDWNLEVNSPTACIVLVSARVLTEVTASVKVNYTFVNYFLLWLDNLSRLEINW